MTTLKELNGTYVLDPAHSRLGFVARHAMVTKVRGNFADFEGSATLVAGAPQELQLEVTAQMASVTTGKADRDAHLKTGDFFEVDAYPTMTFRATDAEIVDDEHVRVTGDLTIKATTKPVTIDFEFGGVATDPYGNERLGFEGAATINRSDFGVNFNAALETGGVLVSDKIQLELEVSAIKQA